MDPDHCGKLDLDPHQSEKQNRDPHHSQNKEYVEDGTATKMFLSIVVQNKGYHFETTFSNPIFCKFCFKVIKKCYDDLKHSHRKI